MVSHLTERFALLGYCIVCLFLVSWAMSVAIHRLKCFDELGSGR